jgi:superfamily II DNA helicase RecQ
MLASDMTQQQAHAVTDGLRKGDYKILFVSPERFVTSSFVALLQSVPQVLQHALCLYLFDRRVMAHFN